jgi:hypothetical protein
LLETAADPLYNVQWKLDQLHQSCGNPNKSPHPKSPPEIFYNTIREKNPSQNGQAKRELITADGGA